MSVRIVLIYKWWVTWKSLPVISWIKAASLFRAKQYSKALEFYKEGLVRHSKHPAAYCARLDLAYCYFKQGSLLEAEEELRFLCTGFPELKEAHKRLARLQIWTGQSLEAAWTMKRAAGRLQKKGKSLDPECAALFVFAALESDAPAFVLKEAIAIARQAAVNCEGEKDSAMLAAARAYTLVKRGDRNRGLMALEEIVGGRHAPFEALIFYIETLLDDNRIEKARYELRKAVSVAPRCPRVLSLLAEAYLKTGGIYNAQYAIQLATAACQEGGWQSPREMHVLARAYLKFGDRISALVVASKARDAGSKLLGSYYNTRCLNRLIADLQRSTVF
jgi:tetratricopeptide (TPR) repeat protein